MPKAQPHHLMACISRKGLWLTVAVVVFLTIGATYLAFCCERGTRDPAQAVEAGAPPASATVGNAGVDDEERPRASRSEVKSGARNLPKSPVDHPFEFIRGGVRRG